MERKIMAGRHLQIPPDKHDKIWMINNLIKHLERELAEEKDDLKRLVTLRKEISALKEKLGELE